METSTTASGIEKEKKKIKNVLRIEKVETITRTDKKPPSALISTQFLVKFTVKIVERE